jgi:2-haloacid dehalogenase
MKDLRAIVFDTFGTLMDWRSSLIDELTAFGATRGLSVDWAALVDAWRGAYKPSMDRVRSGELPWTKLDDLHRASLDTLVERFGITGLSEADLQHINLGWHRLRPWPDVAPGLARLHERYILGPLSNGNVALLIDLARHSALPFDMIFGAEVFGHYKPDPETYLGACRLLSLEPHQVMLCAAHNDDLAAAQRYGLRTAFVPRPSEYGPMQARDLVATGEWDFMVADLGELADRLQRMNSAG